MTRSSAPLPLIFTAPENMRSVDREVPVFDPLLVSIGPFHHGKCPAMEPHKDRILLAMLSRHSGRINQASLVAAMKNLEERALVYYSKTCAPVGFSDMMVRDGCFILELFRLYAGRYTEGDDPIFMARWMLPALALDFVKLENQLPFFVLHELHELTKLPDEPTLIELAGKFLALLCPGLGTLWIQDGQSSSHNHLLEMFHSAFSHRDENSHSLFIDSGDPNPIQSSRWTRMRQKKEKIQSEFSRQWINNWDGHGRNCNASPSVTDLRVSGIDVVNKVPTTTLCNLLDISYINGRLEIPTLEVDHNTKILMRNLIAYEQCNKTIPTIFTSYLTFMDGLVSSTEDVEILRVAGVINHFMNSNEEVSKVLNNLTANVRYDLNEGYLADINKRLYDDHHRTWPQLKVRFWRLVNSREAGIVCIVTVLALYLTALQTVFTVLSYAHPMPSSMRNN